MMNTTEIRSDGRMKTLHGKKKNQGKWARINNQVALTYTEGKDEKVVGYTFLAEMMPMALSPDIPEVEVDF